MSNDVPLYTPCLNGRVFAGMVRIMGSADGPQWGGTGNYVREQDHGHVVAALLTRIEKLQAALWFWLPQTIPRDPEVADHVMKDILLLIGLKDCDVQETAESKGWISLKSADK